MAEKRMDAEAWAKDVLEQVKKMGRKIHGELEGRIAGLEGDVAEASCVAKEASCEAREAGATAKLALVLAIIGTVGALVASWPWYRLGKGPVKRALNDFFDALLPGVSYRQGMAMGARKLSELLRKDMSEDPDTFQKELEHGIKALGEIKIGLSDQEKEVAGPILAMLKEAAEGMIGLALFRKNEAKRKKKAEEKKAEEKKAEEKKAEEKKAEEKKAEEKKAEEKKAEEKKAA